MVADASFRHGPGSSIIRRGIDFTIASQCVLAGTLLLAAPTLLAQRASRVFILSEEGRHFGRSAGSCEWFVGADGTVTTKSLFAPYGSRSGRGDIAVPGALFVLSSDAALVGGRSTAGDGVLEHWASDSGVLRRQGILTMPSADFVGVHCSTPGGAIYLLDGVGNRILRGAWSDASGASLASVVLQPWLTSSTLPVLAQAGQFCMAPGGPAGEEMHLLRWPVMAPWAPYVSVRDLSDGVAIAAGPPPSPLGESVFLDDLTVTEGALAVGVQAPAGAHVEVVEGDTGDVLGSACVGVDGAVLVGLARELVIGRRYSARAVGQQAPSFRAVECIMRRGAPESFADGAIIQPMRSQIGARVGSNFVVEVGVRGPRFAGPIRAYDGAMVIGFRAGRVDPVIPCGSNELLAAGVSVPAEGVAVGVTGAGMIAASVAIPNDPGLVGLVFLTQFVMRDGEDYRLSGIYGAMIEGAAPAGSSALPPVALAVAHADEALLFGRLDDAAPLLLDVLARRL
ncbi:MAG: hypothetical protein FJ306_05450 [Planctomycetes bacterium]|nr:hypothetical protein [Planctomycetota bacterium]